MCIRDSYSMAWLTMQERRSILSGPGQITDAPKGISDSFAILKHCFPMGIDVYKRQDGG